MAKMTKPGLREMGIHNPWLLAMTQSGPWVHIAYTPADNGRVYRCAKWRVIQVGGKANPDSTSWEHFAQVFDVFRPKNAVYTDPGDPDKVIDEKERYRLEAIEWASERYGVTEWERSPFGSYHPAGTMARLRDKRVLGTVVQTVTS